MALTSLTNAVYSDRELLGVMNKVADDDGLVHPQDVAEKLDIRANGRTTPAGTVSRRLSWMRQKGLLEKVLPHEIGLPKSERARYRITDRGKAVMGGRISRAVQRELDKGDPGTEVLLMREVAKRGYVNRDEATAWVVRREWLHQAAQRPPAPMRRKK